jgi:hypothetical protein
MSISFGSGGHAGSESHHYYRQATIPTSSDPVDVGDLWSDTMANLLKRCTSVAPITFVSVEGGSAAHNLFSATHGDVDSADAPANNEVLTYVSAEAKWRAEPASSHGSHHSQSHAIDGADHTGTLTIARGGTGTAANPKVEAVVTAASLKGAATAGAGDANKLPESAETATNKVNYDYMKFPDGPETNAFFQYSIPKGWDEGTITYRVKWTAPSGSGGVVFGLKAVALSDDDALDTAFGAEVAVSDTLIAAGDAHISAESGALTIGGSPAEGDIVFFNIARKTGDASDTLNADVRLLEVILTFTRNSYSD